MDECNERESTRFVHPKGLDNLVRGICAQAKADIAKYPPGSLPRYDAERFFRSDYFAVLTGLDGHAILRDLKRKNKRRKKPDGHGE